MRQSSLDAYEEVKPRIPTHQERIVQALRRIGEGTSRAITRECSLDYHAVARRLAEMEKKGVVKVVGRCANVKNRPLIWKLQI